MHIDLFGTDQRISAQPKIGQGETVAPVHIPQGHIGPMALPGTGRLIYWTGRVAIGLRHQPTDSQEANARKATHWMDRWMNRPGAPKLRPLEVAIH